MNCSRIQDVFSQKEYAVHYPTLHSSEALYRRQPTVHRAKAAPLPCWHTARLLSPVIPFPDSWPDSHCFLILLDSISGQCGSVSSMVWRHKTINRSPSKNIKKVLHLSAQPETLSVNLKRSGSEGLWTAAAQAKVSGYTRPGLASKEEGRKVNE